MKDMVRKILYFLFKIIHYKHFRQKTGKGKPYYKEIIKIKGLRTAVVDNYAGVRSTVTFY